MGGSTTFQEALTQRLNIIKPNKPKQREFIKLLQAQNKKVFLISGGFRLVIADIAKLLSIDEDHIFANRLLFNDDGSYQGFDENEPTSRSGGKATVIQTIKEKWKVNDVVMVGDGSTDLETKPFRLFLFGVD
eukprot:TRINITY_DN1730_c0_g1_i1.p1 TRINITY_DN1730_c0_g1~~TRINITY_DN1730_c0_g1_i1.p1  ORF type:complete len:132 (+),score=32.38 TRINITY_DN1730_c0_g1_i1:72-467(+)